MESLAYSALLVLALVAYANYQGGTLPQWLRAKFLGLPGAPGAPGAAPSPAPGTEALVGEGALSGWTLPVAGTLTSIFGAAREGRRHAGIDLAVPTGTPVGVARAGRVTYAGPSGGYGLRVDVDHGGGYVTRYAHLSRISVRLGQELGAAGISVGLSGSSGESSGPHLHFEIRRNGLALDPAKFFALTGSVGVG